MTHKNVVLLAEIKAAPLATLPLAIPSDEMTEATDDGETVRVSVHSPLDNPFLHSSELFLFLPVRKEGSSSYRFVSRHEWCMPFLIGLEKKEAVAIVLSVWAKPKQKILVGPTGK